MPIPWGTVEAKDQLFLATVAACDPKVGCNVVCLSRSREYTHVTCTATFNHVFSFFGSIPLSQNQCRPNNTIFIRSLADYRDATCYL